MDQVIRKILPRLEPEDCNENHHNDAQDMEESQKIEVAHILTRHELNLDISQDSNTKFEVEPPEFTNVLLSKDMQCESVKHKPFNLIHYKDASLKLVDNSDNLKGDKQLKLTIQHAKWHDNTDRDEHHPDEIKTRNSSTPVIEDGLLVSHTRPLKKHKIEEEDYTFMENQLVTVLKRLQWLLPTHFPS
eukprot:Gb_34660 [translate_table: standard]